MNPFSNVAIAQRSRFMVIGFALLFVAAACGGEATSTEEASPVPSASALASGDPSPEASLDASVMDDDGIELCSSVSTVAERMDGLRTITLRFENRVALDIELGKVQSAFTDLRRSDLGELEDQLDDPLRRLGYRLIDLEIAVEDFRTSRRVRRAATHVEEDASAMDDAVAGFAILARC